MALGRGLGCACHNLERIRTPARQRSGAARRPHAQHGPQVPCLPVSAGLSIQLLLFGDSDAGSSSSRGSKAAVLPKVSVTDDVFALRRAFQEAERLGKQQAEKDIKRASRDETPLD